MSSAKNLVLIGAIAALAFSGCKNEMPVNPATNSAEVPMLPLQVDDYPASQNDHLATLGRVLFYDKQLSLNNNVSCGTCHQQQHAFADNRRFSPGTDGIRGHRNTPVIFPKSGKMFWDGRANSLSDMVLQPVEAPLEMNQNVGLMLSKIRKLDYYTHLFKLAYPNVTNPDKDHITKALTEFISNVSFNNTKFAKANFRQATLTPEENAGRDLFFGQAGCSNCHQVAAAAAGNQYYGQREEGHNIGLDEFTTDRGVGGVTGASHDDGKFMMPTLLNVEFTAPYMHDGRFNTLEEVVEHYNSNVKPHPNLSPFLRDFNGSPKRLNLSADDKQYLIAFLKTLSDPSLITDKKFSDPFITRVP